MATIQDFKKVLKDFFSLYHPRQVKKIDDIAKEFEGDEWTIIHLLAKKYNVDPQKIVGIESLKPEPIPVPVIEEEVTETPVLEEANEETTEEVEESSNEVEEKIVSEESNDIEEEETEELEEKED